MVSDTALAHQRTKIRQVPPHPRVHYHDPRSILTGVDSSGLKTVSVIIRTFSLFIDLAKTDINNL